jgi:hypothetical protein
VHALIVAGAADAAEWVFALLAELFAEFCSSAGNLRDELRQIRCIVAPALVSLSEMFCAVFEEFPFPEDREAMPQYCVLSAKLMSIRSRWRSLNALVPESLGS